MFIVKRIDFDGLENNIAQAKCTTIIGYSSADIATITKFVDNMNTHPSYEGWDGKSYPQFVCEEIFEISLENKLTKKENI